MRKLAWIDLETTGLDDSQCQILEIACIVTDEACNVLGEYETIVNPGPQISYEQTALGMHKRSGLADKVASGRSTKDVEYEVLNFVREYEPRKGRMYIAGNSVHFDARFLKRYMPNLMDHFCHRYLDVSAVGLAAHAWMGDLSTYKADRPHRAKADLYRSIDEFTFYRNLLKNWTGE